jgi:hypothetical protein
MSSEPPSSTTTVAIRTNDQNPGSFWSGQFVEPDVQRSPSAGRFGVLPPRGRGVRLWQAKQGDVTSPRGLRGTGSDQCRIEEDVVVVPGEVFGLRMGCSVRQ